MQKVVFRVDSSSSIGFGHVMRCRNLARCLRKRGIDSIFVCSILSGNLINVLKKEFFVLELPIFDNISVSDYPSQLDAEFTVDSIIASHISSIKWIIVDHYRLNIDWENHVIMHLTKHYSSSIRLMTIDDLGNRIHNADVLLDQNLHGYPSVDIYDRCLNVGCVKFLGPYYSLLPEQYSYLRTITLSRITVNRVLIFFGGSPQISLIKKCIQVLSQHQFKHYFVDVVSPSLNTDAADVEEIVASRENTFFYGHQPSLSHLISSADLAIGAGGSTNWERTCLRLPTILISLADNQVPSSLALHASGHANYIGKSSDITNDLLSSSILYCSNHLPDYCNSMITDGWGTSRISTFLFGPSLPIYFRTVQKDDKDLLLFWSNDPDVRTNSLNSHSISDQEHTEWFNNVLLDSSVLFLIVVDSVGCPLGLIRFNMVHGRIGKQDAKISFLLDKCARGHRLSSLVLDLGIKHMYRSWPNISRLFADVLATNIPSNRVFEKYGFDLFSISKHQKHDSINHWYFDVTF